MKIRIISIIVIVSALIITIVTAITMRQNNINHQPQQVKQKHASKVTAMSAVDVDTKPKPELVSATQISTADPAAQNKVVSNEKISVRGTDAEQEKLLNQLLEKITQLERDIDGLRSLYNGQPDNQSTAANYQDEMNDKSTLINDDGKPTEKAIALAQTYQNYFVDLERQMDFTPDQFVTDDVAQRYTTLFNTRDDWRENVQINSTKCGGSFCKVTITYDKTNLDPVSEIELDAAIVMPTVEDHPYSKVQYKNNSDGKSTMTIYLASKEGGFPAN